MCKKYLVFHILLDVYESRDSFKSLKAVWEILRIYKVRVLVPFGSGRTVLGAH